jgi:hypothetical protein
MAKQKTQTQASEQLASQVQAAVDKWFADHLHNSVVSRDTDVFNLIHNAKPALIDAVIVAVGQTSTSE